ncbi:lambda repressor-like predicted transcriptional regulator [Thermocatellispora tengchongensis]|uniref:Lambda repressor-like predicted transcriptional regulator n=1 Tax=Thermocatellispora tengchongensis TaxID=1073253 RepID=A0A840PM70_9ACTN|nr:XRE family transcriptional regulator [Thermocatellispora tengchongensis]MBB5138750.1 lambda repressor-like predicted transcriptional regulator [Thermocatellispora tengchongensis]
MNDNLRYALAAARLHPNDVAAALAVDPKTVHRWLKGRVPYPRHRWAVADLLQVDEADLWPEVARRHRSYSDEVQAVYPHRWAVPHAVWRDLFQSATTEIGILAYSALFLAEDAGLLRILTSRARAGVKLRILLGDPDSTEVATRGTEEHIGSEVMAARITNALALYQPLCDEPGVEVRLHGTVLYNSIYRADDQFLVNVHAYGVPAAHAPVMHLRRAEDDGTVVTYLHSFERVWASAKPYWP